LATILNELFLINYYDILGIHNGAGIIEIKSAFRHLAKIYHPDKNPSGREHFTRILKAYEVLSDPIQKSSYDFKLKYAGALAANDVQSKRTETKTWRFDEKELKRRQYYNDYIKKQNQAAESFGSAPEQKKRYSDFKYIFFATPLAVALFLLIMNLATHNRSQKDLAPSSFNQTTQNQSAGTILKTGMPFYEDFFGPQSRDLKLQERLTIKNNSGEDVVIGIFDEQIFLRSLYIKNGEASELLNLPAHKLQVRYCSGKNFDPSIKVGRSKTKGIFTKDLHYYKCAAAISLNRSAELILLPNHNDFKEILEMDFFKTNQKL
jgi:hypothetical protein